MRVVMRVVHTCGEAEAYSITARDYSIALRSPQTASSSYPGVCKILDSLWWLCRVASAIFHRQERQAREGFLLFCALFATHIRFQLCYDCFDQDDDENQ